MVQQDTRIIGGIAALNLVGDQILVSFAKGPVTGIGLDVDGRAKMLQNTDSQGQKIAPVMKRARQGGVLAAESDTAGASFDADMDTLGL